MKRRQEAALTLFQKLVIATECVQSLPLESLKSKLICPFYISVQTRRDSSYLKTEWYLFSWFMIHPIITERDSHRGQKEARKFEERHQNCLFRTWRTSTWSTKRLARLMLRQRCTIVPCIALLFTIITGRREKRPAHISRNWISLDKLSSWLAWSFDQSHLLYTSV